jgi:hypothetical protein
MTRNFKHCYQCEALLHKQCPAVAETWRWLVGSCESEQPFFTYVCPENIEQVNSRIGAVIMSMKTLEQKGFITTTEISCSVISGKLLGLDKDKGVICAGRHLSWKKLGTVPIDDPEKEENPI